ncbi:MAG TPA: ATP-binding protein [Actinomycetota bacterium]|nr:ATP-binding protein [Actinomycetota bacterium]
MKCKVCREHAVVDIRRHNAGFCRDHFLEHTRNQVARAIKEFEMFRTDDRLLLAVSGGKDSLALWDILIDLGYDVTGFYLDLGIGGYSNRSKELSISFAEKRSAKLIVRSIETEHGFTVPELSALTGRVPCSGCGLSKRYEFNRAALEEGFEILVTGHNLDDEVATLFGNVLHWNTEMLARQMPVLNERILGEGDDAHVALVRKAKPLVKLLERETAAYALLRGIDYVIEECPMVEGNTQHQYKHAITQLEESSPGTKSQFYAGFLRKAADRFREAAKDSDDIEIVACISCGAPTVLRDTHESRCSFCKTKALATKRKAGLARRRPARRGKSGA